MLKYVNAEDIERYKAFVLNNTGKTEVDLVAMVNYFAEGAITTVSNVLYEHMVEGDCVLEHGLQPGCRCGGCHEWQLVDQSTGDIKASAESLSEWANRG